MTLYKNTMHYFDKSSLWLKSECIVVPLKKLDAQNCYYILPILGTQFLNADWDTQTLKKNPSGHPNI